MHSKPSEKSRQLSPIDSITNLIFSIRIPLLIIIVLITGYLGSQALKVKIDAGFEKLLPLKHAYMETFLTYRDDFGGANRVLISLRAVEDDIFNLEFFEKLQAVTDELFFLPGVDRSQVTSIFTPNVRYTEVVEDGFSGGNVVPADFQANPESIAKVKENILKAGIVGRLVANDFSSAIVSASLLEIDPQTGQKLNYHEVANKLEDIRRRYENDQIKLEIIGFAKMIGDIGDGAKSVIRFFIIAFGVTALLVFMYAKSWQLTLLPLTCSLVAVVWQVGLLECIGFGIDPMSTLVPFLVFAIGVSHGVQMINRIKQEVLEGNSGLAAAKNSFKALLIPGGIALASDTIGFLTILFIKIRIIQELAITASIGVGAIIITNLILLPLLASFFRLDKATNLKQRSTAFAPLWQRIAQLSQRKPASITLAVALSLAVLGLWKSTDLKIGDLHAGVPELWPDARYNLDTESITTRYSIGVDVLTLISVTEKDGCVDFEVMNRIDEVAWKIQNIDGVKSVVTLPFLSKIINAGYNEGFPKWQVLPDNTAALAQTMTFIETSSGLLNRDCDAIPIYIFTRDHKAETIKHIIDRTKTIMGESTLPNLTFKLATGNVGVMAATNEAVSAAQIPMFLYLYLAIFVLCLLTFKSIKGTICVILPLALVSILSNALMVALDIGLKVSTLPVIALGVGIGVDYGIYIYTRLIEFLKSGLTLNQAYFETLKASGNAVIFTGFTLAMGVSTWIFSDLKFQADMGILLTFMFLLNMVASILIIPALSAFLLRRQP